MSDKKIKKKNIKEKSESGGFNTGTSLVLVIFVLLCLVTFSVLAYATAISDYKLSESAAKGNSEYYEAFNLVQEKEAEVIDAYIRGESLENLADVSVVSMDEAKTVVTIIESISDTRYIEATISISGSRDNPDISVLKYTTKIDTDSLSNEEDDTMNLLF